MFPALGFRWRQPKAVAGDHKVPLVIGIAGGTCAGKTRLAEGLMAEMAAGAGSAALLAMDSFYRQQPPDAIADGSADFDDPAALDLDAMAAALAALRAGQVAEIPVYDRAASRVAGSRTVSPHAVLLVEGLFVLEWPAIRGQCDLKVFITVEAPVQHQRRRARDLDGYHRSQARLARDLARAVEAEARHVRPSRDHADLVLSGTALLSDQIAACREALRQRGLWATVAPA
jgi:uridine kinase